MHIYYEGQVLWSQIDANQHMRHSAYADVAAQARLNMLGGVGLNPVKLFEYRVGPVLFKEELFYLREIALGELIKVSCQVSRSRADGSRWSIRHEIFRADGVKAALINADGAWINMDKRRLTLLPPELGNLFAHAPLSDDYTEDIPNSKQ